jgi:hypothetical protein
MELVHERAIALVDDSGRRFEMLRVYAQPQTGGTYAGILEFLPADDGAVVRSARETTQSTADGVSYWATGLEPIYLEGALERAQRHPVEPVSPAAPATAAPGVGRRVVRIEVETVDPQLPLRVMGTRTLTRGLRRRIHDVGAVVYQGPTREGCYAFLVQFGSDNAAAVVANTLWNELRTAAGVFVEGARIVNGHAALKNALITVAPDRLAG